MMTTTLLVDRYGSIGALCYLCTVCCAGVFYVVNEPL